MNPLLLALAMAAGGLQLSADSLTITPGSRLAVASGNVVAHSDAFTVVSEEAHVQYIEQSGRRVVDELLLKRAVEATRVSDGATGTSDEARWARASGTLWMTGSPEVVRGQEILRGETIEFGTVNDTLFVKRPNVTLATERATPLVITALRLNSPPGGAHLLFEENVVIIDDDLVTTAAHADVELTATGGEREVKKATLTGRVVAKRGTQTGRANKATWNARTRDLVMEGNPIVEQEGESIAGKRITLEADTGRARVETAVVKIKRSK